MDISHFKSKFNGGTRANRFLVSGEIGIGFEGSASTKRTFHVRSTFIPPITNITLTHSAYGRKLNIPGDREYSPWQLTIYDDLDSSTSSGSGTTTVANLWKQFSTWSNNINLHETNIPGSDLTSPHLNYKRDWQIQHLDLNGDIIKTFYLNGCWPKNVSDIDFNMTRKNFLNTFSVILLYDAVQIAMGSDNTLNTD